MKAPIGKVYYIAGLCLITLLIIGGVVAVARRQRRPLPPVISKVKQLEVASVIVEGADEETAVAVIEIRNTSDKAVIAVAVEVGDGKDASGTNLNGIREGDLPPLVVIEPYGSTKVRFSLSNLKFYKPGTPIKIGGAMFADGDEEGDEDTLGTMRRQKEHQKAKKQKKEGATSQQ
ncbi:MAG TPA: hypothetical protein VJ866_18450 [Pyrinomonadaceae bacterium]|nr:hypothetical protein [Pyrinomonadaceae bacterium]